MDALSSLDYRILTGPDPFEFDSVNSPWEPLNELDVQAIHADASSQILELIEKVRQDRRTRSALLLGQPGSGKTHLLGRIKARLRQPALFVYVTPFADPGAVHRHVLRQIVASLDYPLGLAGPGGDGSTQLTAVLEAIGRLDRDRLFRPYPGIDPDVIEGLGRLHDGSLWRLARSWLSGSDLDRPDLDRLGVTHTLFGEEEARHAIISLAHLLAEWGPVVLAFDQVESLAGAAAEPGFVILGRSLAQLHDEAPNLLLVISCLESVYFQHASQWPQSTIDRLARHRIPLKPLSPAEMQQLCHVRMLSLYQGERPPWPGYPFTPEFFESVAGLSKQAGPRLVLQHCRQALQEMRRAGRAELIKAAHPLEQKGVDRTQLARADVRRALQSRVSRYLASPPATPPDGAELARTLRLLLETYQRAGRVLGGFTVHGVTSEPGPVQGRPALFTAELERDGRPARVGVAVVDTENGRSFAAQMEALLRRVREGRWHRAIVLRDHRLEVPPTWKRGLDHLRDLTSGLGAFVACDTESLAYFEAIRSLLADASSGDVVSLGTALAPDEVLAHLVNEDGPGRITAVDQMLEALRRLMESAAGATVAAVPGDPASPVTRMLREVLKERRVMAAAQAAEVLRTRGFSVDAAGVESAARSDPDRIRVYPTLDGGRVLVWRVRPAAREAPPPAL